MESCIYLGRVRHRRSRPVEHAFEVPLFMVYLDLGELEEVFRGRWLWSTQRPAFAWFRRRDHLGDPNLPLDICVRDLVEQHTGRRPEGPVRLLTHLRYAGYVINPVSFFYCFGPGGDRLEAIVAEVTNTPWGERHCYVLTPGIGTGRSDAIRLSTPKEFHVSPFMGMQMVYDWSLASPGSRLDLHIANGEGPGEPLFEAALSMQRREIDGRSLAGVLVRHPFLTLEIVAAIYWQALRLRLKGTPFHPHPREGEALMEITP